MAIKNGNLNKHMGGKQAARTRNINALKAFHATTEGSPTIDTQTIAHKRQAARTPDKTDGNKWHCAECDKWIERAGWNPHINMVHSSGSKPKAKAPKFAKGDKVYVNGFPKSSIRTNRVRRVIEDVKIMKSGNIYYKIPNGTNTTGLSFCHYAEKEITLITAKVPQIECTALMIRPPAAIRRYIMNICPDCTLHISFCECYKLRCDKCNQLKADHSIRLGDDGNVVDVCPGKEYQYPEFEPADGMIYYITNPHDGIPY